MDSAIVSDRTEAEAAATSGPAALRWIVLALVFMAGVLNFADRQIIAVLKPVLERDLHWSDSDYAGVISGFQLASAAALIPAGWLLDRLGVRIGYPIGVGAWSLAAIAHGVARTLGQFTAARAVLGAAEALNAPSAIKSVAAWFDVKERSLAMGIVNTAPNIGNIVAPLTVPALALAFGWRAAFVITGGAGAIWIGAWLAASARMRQAGNFAVAAPAAGARRVSWLALLRDRRTLAVAGAKLISDQSWWFLLFWAPDFFHRRFGLDLGHLGPPLALTYALAAVGALAGGWATGRLIRRGALVGAARKRVLLGAALVVSPIALAQFAPNAWVGAAVLGVALAGHQAFSTNIFAMSADIFELDVLGRAIGIASTTGTLGGMGILAFAGWSLDHGWGYGPLFAVCTAAYPLALLWIQLMLPVIRPAGVAAP